MRRTAPTLLAALLLLGGAAGCGSSGGGTPADQYPEPAFDPVLFGSQSAVIQHAYFPLVPGTTFTYEGETDEGSELVEVYVTHDTRVILTVTCIVVRDRGYVDGELDEETFDWYAQDLDGNIWYLGEDSTEYDEGVPVSNAGSWEAGVDGAVAGILIKATPIVGDAYQQEYYAGVAEDMARVVALDATVVLTDGTTYTGCLQTQEWNPLEWFSDEFKFCAPGVGLVLESEIDGSNALELTGITTE